MQLGAGCNTHADMHGFLFELDRPFQTLFCLLLPLFECSYFVVCDSADFCNRHARIHSQERPFTCPFKDCAKTFIQRSALTVHTRVHTGERPHVCESCSKAFSDSSSLARHRRIHTGRRPYKCLVPGCGKSFCRKTTLTKHTRRNHADAEGTYTGAGGPITIMSNSISMNRCALPPHNRSTFPQGLEHHYLSGIKVEENPHSAPYGFHMHTEYPSTPYSAPAMSSCPSSSTSYDGSSFGRRSSVAMSGYMSSSSCSFHSPSSNSSRMCPTPNTLTPAPELSHFPRTPDFRDTQPFGDVSVRPQFNHISIANMSCGPNGSEPQTLSGGFHGSVMAPSASFSMMPSSCVIDSHDTSNIDPNLWDNGSSTNVPVPSVNSQICEQPSYQQPRQNFQQQQLIGSADFAQHSAGSERYHFLRSSAQHPVASSS
nr:RPG-box-binding factor [Ustilago esculenta]